MNKLSKFWSLLIFVPFHSRPSLTTFGRTGMNGENERTTGERDGTDGHSIPLPSSGVFLIPRLSLTPSPSSSLQSRSGTSERSESRAMGVEGQTENAIPLSLRFALWEDSHSLTVTPLLQPSPHPTGSARLSVV